MPSFERIARGDRHGLLPYQTPSPTSQWNLEKLFKEHLACAALDMGLTAVSRDLYEQSASQAAPATSREMPVGPASRQKPCADAGNASDWYERSSSIPRVCSRLKDCYRARGDSYSKHM